MTRFSYGMIFVIRLNTNIIARHIISNATINKTIPNIVTISEIGAYPLRTLAVFRNELAEAGKFENVEPFAGKSEIIN
jgi:hypothetical protein